MAILTPGYTGTITEENLANDINISKFVNNVGFLPVVLNNPQDGESIVFDAALGYWTNKMVTGGASEDQIVMGIVTDGNLLDGGLSSSSYVYTANGGAATSTYDYNINGGTA